MHLIIVESPTKARTLARFLGNKYRIEATYGHLRDLPKSELGVDIEHDFKPQYVIARDKARRVRELKNLDKNKETIILATDPDREGEAIAYHMAVILSQKGNRITSEKVTAQKFHRITFREITQQAIEKALQHPGKINMKLVNAQQARRILDRLVGYKLSPLLQQKLSRRWLSAGRVQSVCVRLIVEREREIARFKKEEYWVIEGEFGKNVILERSDRISLESGKSNGILSARSDTSLQNDNALIRAKLISKDNIKYEQSRTVKLFDGNYTYTKTSISNKTDTELIQKDLQLPFVVSAVDKKQTKRSPAPPYATSGLQIDAGRRLGYTSKRIMSLAQSLYEDGLITYHRTDSFNLSAPFLDSCKNFIEQNYGQKYSRYRTYATKSKTAQEAHEAIRPTDINRKTVNDDRGKLYELIWKRTVASQMSDAVFDSTTIKITSGNNYLFETQGSVIQFDGFLKVAGYDDQTVVLPAVTQGEKLELLTFLPEQKFTLPPPRYSEASLIKALEDDGIGRPSTYAPTISTIQERMYVKKMEKDDGRKGKNFIPTDLGFLVNDFLVRHFPEIVDLLFTATMETGLDEIADQGKDWVETVRTFFTPFKIKLDEVEKNVVKTVLPVEKTGDKCPECKKGDVIIKQGRYGKFYACSNFPECKFTKNIIEKLDIKCPECHQGDVVVRKTRKGRTFFGCSNYPKCKYASWTKPNLDKPL